MNPHGEAHYFILSDSLVGVPCLIVLSKKHVNSTEGKCHTCWDKVKCMPKSLEHESRSLSAVHSECLKEDNKYARFDKLDHCCALGI